MVERGHKSNELPSGHLCKWKEHSQNSLDYACRDVNLNITDKIMTLYDLVWSWMTFCQKSLNLSFYYYNRRCLKNYDSNKKNDGDLQIRHAFTYKKLVLIERCPLQNRINCHKNEIYSTRKYVDRYIGIFNIYFTCI